MKLGENLFGHDLFWQRALACSFAPVVGLALEAATHGVSCHVLFLVSNGRAWRKGDRGRWAVFRQANRQTDEHGTGGGKLELVFAVNAPVDEQCVIRQRPMRMRWKVLHPHCVCVCVCVCVRVNM